MTHVQAGDDETEDEVRRRELGCVVVKTDEEGDPAGDVREEEKLVEVVAHVGDARNEEEGAARCEKRQLESVAERDERNTPGNHTRNTGLLNRLGEIERVFEEEEKRVQQPAEDNESTSDTVEVVHLLVSFAEDGQSRVLAGKEEEGGELGDRDGGGAVEV